MAGAKAIQILRQGVTLADEAEIQLKKYEGLNDDDLSVTQISTMPQAVPTVIDYMRTICIQAGNCNPNGDIARPNWKEVQLVRNVVKKDIL